MSTVSAQPFSGTYLVLPEPSSFAFAVRPRLAVGRRGSAARRRRGSGARGVRARRLDLRGPATRDEGCVLGPDFFDAERHSEITFRSTAVRLAGDGRAEVDGELTIRGVTRPVTAGGHYAPPRPSGFGEVAGLQLQTTFDRREFGFEWQMEMPGGGNAVGWDVQVNIDLLLRRDDADVQG